MGVKLDAKQYGVSVSRISQFVRYGHLTRSDAAQVERRGILLREAASLSPLGSLETVAGSGHLLNLEKPYSTTAWIAESIDASVAACR